MFRYGDWHASEQHWTNVGRQLRIEHRHVEDSDVAAIRDTLPFGPPNPMHVLDLSPELGAAPDFDFPSLGRGNVQAAPSLSRMASHGAEPQGQSRIGTEGALRRPEAQKGNWRGPKLEVQNLPKGHIGEGGFGTRPHHPNRQTGDWRTGQPAVALPPLQQPQERSRPGRKLV